MKVPGSDPISFPKRSAIPHGLLIAIIILFGISCLASQYLFNRSFHFDEARVALWIPQNSIITLLQPSRLNYTKKVDFPIGFILLEKTLVRVLGDNEYVWRLVPFLSSALVLVLFPLITRGFLHPTSLTIALALTAFSPWFIYRSSELKAYSSDILINLILLKAFMFYSANYREQKRFWILCLMGIFSIVFSFPSIFILSSGCGVLLMRAYSEKDFQKMRRIVRLGFLWSVCFLAYYLISVRQYTGYQELVTYWNTVESGFLSFDSPFLDCLKKNFFVIKAVFTDPLYAKFPFLALCFFIIGCVASIHMRNYWLFLMVIQVLFTLAASFFKKYPFSGRLVFFLIPSFACLIAEGWRYCKERLNKRLQLLVWLILPLLLVPQLIRAGQFLISPWEMEESRPVLQFVKENRLGNDYAYVYYGAGYAFRYYSRMLHLNFENIVWGSCARSNRQVYLAEIDRLKGKGRVWVIYSHPYKDEVDFILRETSKTGKLISHYTAQGAGAFLFEF